MIERNKLMQSYLDFKGVCDEKIKHTPAPWEIWKDDEGHIYTIGDIGADDGWRLDCTEEDAILASCAPELLEVAKGAYGYEQFKQFFMRG